MIKYNLNNINDWNYGDDNIKKVYHHNSVCYQKISKLTPIPPFNGKWIATYEGGVTSSAECDASSAITQNEISLTHLVAVEIGDCVTSIGYSAFYGCSGLTSVTIPDSVTSIGGNVFGQCSGLTSMTIPSGVTSIGSGVFYFCTSLTSIDIPDGVTSIGQSTFYNCISLTSVTIPSSVTSISANAFTYCRSLTEITIPNNVTSIGQSAFYDCRSLTSVTIPDSVTSIGGSAFYSCISLTSVTVNAITPPTLVGSYAFGYTSNYPIYVPSASVEAYKAASGWSEYASRIQAIPT